jgi:hypothetical protein
MTNWMCCGSLEHTFVTLIWFKLLVLVRNRHLGDSSHIFCKQWLIIPTGMFYPVVFKYLLFFVMNPSLLGEKDYGLMKIQTGMKVDVL